MSVLAPQIEPSASIEYRPEDTLTGRAVRGLNPSLEAPLSKEGQRQLQITREAQQKQVEKQSVKIPTMQELLQGNIYKIGNEDVDIFTLEDAKKGNQEALSKLQDQIDKAYALTAFDLKRPVIAGVDFTPTGIEFDSEIFANLSKADRKKQLKIRENRTEFFTEYLLKEIPNPYVQQILLDTFSTKQLADDTLRKSRELYGSDLPNLLAAAIRSIGKIDDVAVAAFKAVSDGEKDFSDVWEADREDREKSFAIVQRAMNTYNGYNSLAKALNERFENEFIKRHGQDVYDIMFPVVETEEGKLRTPIITEEGAKKLLDYSFNGLPTLEKAVSYFVQDGPLAVAFTGFSMYKGGKKLKRVNDWIEKTGADDVQKARMRQQDPAALFRYIQKTEARTSATRNYFNFLDRIATRFNLRGNEGALSDLNKNREVVENLRKNIIETQKELDGVKLWASGDKKRITQLEADLRIMETEHARAYLRGGLIDDPLITSFVMDEGLIAAGQAFGQDILAPALGVSPETGQIIGAFGLGLGGRPLAKGAKVVTLWGADVATVTVGRDVMRMFEDVVSFTSGGRIPIGTLVDRRYDIINDIRVREGLSPLTSDQIKTVNKISNVFKRVPENEREGVLENIIEATEVQNKLVNSFKPEDQAEAAEKLRLTFASMSQINYLKTIEFQNTTKGRGATDKLLAAINVQNEQELLIDGVSSTINRLREMLAEGGSNVEDLSNMSMWLDNLEEAAQNQVRAISERRDAIGQLLDLKVKDINADLTEKEFNLIVDARIGLDRSALNNIDSQKRIIREEHSKLAKSIDTKIKDVQFLQGVDNVQYRNELGLILEDAYEVQMAYFQRLAKAAYAEVDVLMKGKEVDIQDLIKETLQIRDNMDSQSLRGLFQAEREFFNSTSGRQLLKTFEGMANRFFEEFDEAELKQLRAQFTIKNFEDGTPNPLAQGMPEDPSNFELGLAMVANSGDFSMFKATAYEVDEIKKHLERMADKTDIRSEKRTFFESASKFNQVLMNIPEIATPLQRARTEYKSIKFDPYLEEGLAYRIDQGYKGKAAVSGAGEYKNVWKEGFEPETWHEPLRDAMIKTIEDPNVDSIPTVVKEVRKAVKVWAQRLDEPGVLQTERRYGFDLTTDEGMNAFASASTVISALVYEAWGFKQTKRLQQAKEAGVALGSPSARLTQGEYDFTRAARIRQLQQSATVRVKTQDGIIDVQLLNFNQMQNTEVDISNLIQQDAGVAKQFEQFETSTEALVKSTTNKNSVEARLELNSVRKLEKLQGMNYLDIYNNIILVQGRDGIDKLENDFILARTAKTREFPEGQVSVEEATKEFDAAMKYLLPKALMERAGIAPSNKYTFKTLEGETKIRETMLRPEALLNDLNNDNFRAIFDEYLDSESLEFMENIAKFMKFTQQSDRVPSDLLGGSIRPMSDNEVLSRLFNWSRGMVGTPYLAGEMALRKLSQADTNILELVARDKDAGEIIAKMITNPSNVTTADVKYITPLLQAFVVKTIIHDGYGEESEEEQTDEDVQ